MKDKIEKEKIANSCVSRSQVVLAANTPAPQRNRTHPSTAPHTDADTQSQDSLQLVRCSRRTLAGRSPLDTALTSPSRAYVTSVLLALAFQSGRRRWSIRGRFSIARCLLDRPRPLTLPRSPPAPQRSNQRSSCSNPPDQSAGALCIAKAKLPVARRDSGIAHVRRFLLVWFTDSSSSSHLRCHLPPPPPVLARGIWPVWMAARPGTRSSSCSTSATWLEARLPGSRPIAKSW